MADVIYIDVEEGLKRVMNNSALFAKLLVKFKDYTHLSEIEAAMAEGDMEKALNSAHTVKGLAANLSMIELYKHVQELETQIKTELEAQMKAETVNKDTFKDLLDDLLKVIKDIYNKTMQEADKVIKQYA
ncbi:MAG: Hpt domain-containing protein [Treponema sp.]|jgi:HPt (histidine-containing phosphotransfer) domain-containing protein|nr:Hpt domain-containing protein [Treponema sp.]